MGVPELKRYSLREGRYWLLAEGEKTRRRLLISEPRRAISIYIGPRLTFFSRSFQMRPPHWLDGVIGDLREVDDIALAIAESPRLRQAIQKGIDAGFQWENLHEKDPKRLGSSFEQEIRVAIVEAVKSEH